MDDDTLYMFNKISIVTGESPMEILKFGLSKGRILGWKLCTGFEDFYINCGSVKEDTEGSASRASKSIDGILVVRMNYSLKFKCLTLVLCVRILDKELCVLSLGIFLRVIFTISQG